MVSKDSEDRDFPGGPMVRQDSSLPLQGVRVQSLVGELRSHVPQGVAKKIIIII